MRPEHPSSILVSQARPFLFCSADHFQYTALKAIGAVERKGSGLRDKLNMCTHLFDRASPRRPRGSPDDQTDKGRTPKKDQKKKGPSSPSYEEENEVAKPSFNFFDFREGSDDIFVESPDSLVKKMRQQAKDRMR